MDANSDIYKRMISMWDIQDSLLQSYRNIFIVSQAIIFSITVFIATTAEAGLSYLLFPIGIFLLFLWANICKHRGCGVWFFQLQLLHLERGDQISSNLYTFFKEWEEKNNYKEKLAYLKADELGKSLVISPSRKIIDKVIPTFFLIMWIILGIIVLQKITY